MIKPLDEYSPEDRAFVEYVRRLRSEYPRPESLHQDLILRDAGPLNVAEIRALWPEGPRDDVELSETRNDIAKFSATDVGVDARSMRGELNAASVALATLRKEVSSIVSALPHLGTQAELKALRADLVAMEARMIKWCVSTTLALAVLMFAAAGLGPLVWSYFSAH